MTALRRITRLVVIAGRMERFASEASWNVIQRVCIPALAYHGIQERSVSRQPSERGRPLASPSPLIGQQGSSVSLRRGSQIQSLPLEIEKDTLTLRPINADQCARSLLQRRQCRETCTPP